MALGETIPKVPPARRPYHQLLLKRRWTLGMQAIYRRSRAGGPTQGHKVYPYLLKGIAIPNSFRGSMDWYPRYVVACTPSNTLDASFCVEALEVALSNGKPEIINTGQGSQFTSEACTKRLEQLEQGVETQRLHPKYPRALPAVGPGSNRPSLIDAVVLLFAKYYL